MNEGLPDVSGYEKEMAILQKEIRDENSKLNNRGDGFESELHRTVARIRVLEDLIAEGHNYHFVGKVGAFCPIKPGKGGGLLLREKDGKYYSATGSKGYRWLEAEVVKTLGKEEDIDRSYYGSLVDDAVENISKFGDFEWFVSERDPLPGEPPCGSDKYSDCFDCPNCNYGKDEKCKFGYDIIPF
jgi:hypothetical protein